MRDSGRKWLIRGGIAVAALVALGYGAIFFYTEVLNDSPDELDADDLSNAVAETSPSSASSGSTSGAPDVSTEATSTGTSTSPGTAAGTSSGTSSRTPAADEAAGSGAGLDGAWSVTDESVMRYRVEEVLAGVNTTAVGQTKAVEGSLQFDGTTVSDAEFTVDVATFESDESRRDDQFNGRIMETEQFPTATFTLTEPIDLGTEPEVGEQVTASAAGDLTLHGVTQAITFDVTAEAGRSEIGVLGSIPVEFADYGIDDPSFGAVSTEENGSIEFVLVFQRA